LPGNSKIVFSETVLVRVIVIEVGLDITRSIRDYEHAHEHGELNWRAKLPRPTGGIDIA